ncbi:hypothetical protein LZC95_24680 [Pendulispora brunnea]|uniref:Secreted protein n=1 Tax=Pendulispora brunnea TaxID=2905690 RepID=A0ABZ2KQJ5_9BACT
MWKKAGGLVLGGCLLIAVGGYGVGCNGTGNSYAPLDACAGPSTGYPGYGPSFKDTGDCSEQNLSSFFTNCISNTATQSACNSYLDSVPACANCLFGLKQGDSTLGAYMLNFPNTPGYLAYRGEASQTCVVAYHNVIACSIWACQTCGSSAELAACNAKVLGAGGVCASENAIYTTACGSDSDKVAVTQAQNKPISNLVEFARTFCGKPIAGDGGTDAGDGGGDASTTDAGDASIDAPADG